MLCVVEPDVEKSVRSWFGDTRLQSTSHASLQGLRELTGTDAAVRIIGRGKEPDDVLAKFDIDPS